jgi:L-ascorbate metabolism protein UlaG (beta-lactamase superfamily)
MIQSKELTYLANAGVLLKLGDKKIVIDGFCASTNPLYKSTPADISEQMILGTPPFDNIDLMLITHEHEDHFDGGSIARFLQHNPNTVVISTCKVIAKIKGLMPSSHGLCLIALNPSLSERKSISANGILVQAMAMLHDGKGYSEVKNLAYLVQYEKTILHLGDAALVKENFVSLELDKEKIDLLIANFPFVGLPSGRKIVTDMIKPQKMVSVHLPHQALDSGGWIEATKKRYERVKEEFIPTEFLEDLNYKIPI